MKTPQTKRTYISLLASLVLGSGGQYAAAQAMAPGEMRGSATEHTSASSADVIAKGSLVLPAGVVGGEMLQGRWAEVAAAKPTARVPVVVFMHGSSGLGLPAIGEWQRWLASQGIASFAPDSFALPDRLTYASPIDKGTYERIHKLRASEARLAIDAVATAPWADPRRIVLAGTSEGSPAVARYDGTDVVGRIVYSWSCEDNYFVRSHGTVSRPGQPALNIISSTDPFFSAVNTYLGAPTAVGHCGAAWKDNPQASIVLLPGAPHTLINLPRARESTAGFLKTVFGL